MGDPVDGADGPCRRRNDDSDDGFRNTPENNESGSRRRGSWYKGRRRSGFYGATNPQG